MMKLKIYCVFIILFISNKMTLSQYGPPCIPSSRIVDWSNAGLLSETPVKADNLININDYSGSDYDKIVNAIIDANGLPGTTIIYFPSGVYIIEGTINISNVKKSGIIFQGHGSSGSDKTTLRFSNIDVGDNCFKVYGSWENSRSEITQNISKGANKIHYADDSGIALEVGDWIKFSEPGFDDEYDANENGTSADDVSDYIGQITRVFSTSSNSVTIKDAASKSYFSSNNMWIREIDPVKNIGFENFYIERTNSTKGYGCTFKFNIAVNCWIKGIESYYCTGYHVNVSRSSHIEISGCYIHHATNYDSYEGTGYGVVLGYSTTNCLIENNIFRKARHAMLVGGGANCNVFAYNYSREQTWDWDWLYSGADICLHGRYPYSNLFEHNKVERIHADPSHGINGPYNTMLRNDVYDGKIFLCNADYTNAVGCNISPHLIEFGYVDTNPQLAEWIWENFTDWNVHNSHNVYNLRTISHLEPGDDIGGTVTHEQWYQSGDIYINTFLNAFSYYYSSGPDFLSSDYDFPSFGPNTNLDHNGHIEITDQGIPAEDRYLNSIKTYNPNPTKNPPSAPILSLSGTWGENPTLSWVDGGEPDIDHFVLKKQYINDCGTWITYVDPAPNPYIDTYMTSQKFGSTVANYWVKSVDIGNYESPYSNMKSATGLGPAWKKVPEKDIVYKIMPLEFDLVGNYPNPFNSVTTIRFGLPEEQKVDLSIYDLGGNKVKTLLRDVVPAGYHQVQWDGKDGSGKNVQSGVFIYRISSNNESLVSKMVLTK